MTSLAVLDTNILISAMGWNGPSHRCLEMAEQGRFTVVTCEQILEEFASNLQRRLKFSEAEILSCCRWLISFAHVVSINGTLQGACSDPKDDKILECAIAAKATHIVSGDQKHLLSMGQYEGIPIITPRQFVELLESENDKT
jgi:putative PIN family toxin of toxin-antitoxin system